MLLSSQRMADHLAIAALVVYVSGELAFRYATILQTYPVLADFKPLIFIECLSTGIAIASLAIRNRRFANWQLVLAASALVVLFISAMRTIDYTLLYGYILIVAIANIRREKLFASYGVTVLIVIVVLIIMSVAGLIYNKDVIPNTRLVFSYGFGHPNTLGALLFAGIGAIVVALWDRPTWVISFCLAAVAALFSYAFLSSHAAAAILLVLTAITGLGHVIKRYRKGAPRTMLLFMAYAIIPMTFLAIMLISTVFYDGDNILFAQLNSLIHGRPHYANEYFVDIGGFTLFGRRYVTDGGHYHNGVPFSGVDSGYCQLVLVHGMLVTIVIGGTYLVASWRLSASSWRHLALALFTLCALYLIVEPHQLDIATGFGALLMAAAFAPPNDHGAGGAWVSLFRRPRKTSATPFLNTSKQSNCKYRTKGFWI